MSDLIKRQDALDALMGTAEFIGEENVYAFVEYVREANKKISELPSAQPERLTDDDFETIRIHLSAFKERLCNQHRYKEAEEYQRLIDRLINFASAQPEYIRCKDCKHGEIDNPDFPNEYFCRYKGLLDWNDGEHYCSDAERKE